VDGLKSEIRSDVDTACVLALLQEEVLDRDRQTHVRPFPFSSAARQPAKTPLPLPSPPAPDKISATVPATDRRAPEPTRGRPYDDKLAALRSYRRAKGLCIKCAEKWHRDHKCPDSVQLHVLQEVFDLLQLE